MAILKTIIILKAIEHHPEASDLQNINSVIILHVPFPSRPSPSLPFSSLVKLHDKISGHLKQQKITQLNSTQLDSIEINLTQFNLTQLYPTQPSEDYSGTESDCEISRLTPCCLP